MDPKWLIVKVVIQKKTCFSDRWNAMIGHIGVVSHHLRLLLGAIELIVLCEFICKLHNFDVHIRETLLYK